MAIRFADWKHMQDMVKVATGMNKDPEFVQKTYENIGQKKGAVDTLLDLPVADK